MAIQIKPLPLYPRDALLTDNLPIFRDHPTRTLEVRSSKVSHYGRPRRRKEETPNGRSEHKFFSAIELHVLVAVHIYFP
jgi:hypothetical protein